MSREDEELVQAATEIRKDILKLAFDCNGPAHLGGALSIADILSVLYGRIMNFNPENPLWLDRDRFILSKGHGVLAFYAALHRAGFFSKETLSTFKVNGSDLIAHPVMNMDLGIESSNGSLGHGLSFSVGIALALKKKRSRSRVYVLLGDGECEEGSVWEAAMLASKLQLDNLVCIVDCNGLQSDGPVSRINTAEWLVKRWESFGWKTDLVDGHNVSQLISSLLNPEDLFPRVIVARTIKGKGISFMENNNTWHHNRLTEESFYSGMEELDRAHSRD